MKKRVLLSLLSIFFLFSLAEGAEKAPAKKKAKKEEVKKVQKKEETFMGIKKINSYLPKSLKKKLSVKLQLRQRFEFNENKFDGIDGGTFDNDGFQLLRSRLTVEYKPIKMVRAFLQLQDSRIWDYRPPVIPSINFYEDTIDIRQAYADVILKMGPKKSFTVRVGRQELAYGSERLIGGFNWNNVAQTFDAFKAIFKMNKLQADLFFARKVKINHVAWNPWDEQDDFMGLYIQSKHVKNHQIHLYTLFRNVTRNSNTGTTAATPVPGALSSEATLGFRVKGKQKAIDYVVEMAYQFGRYTTAGGSRKDIDALAFIMGVGFTCPCPSKPRIGFEINYGSGDDNPGNGTQRTFDNLYPTNHKFYGYMDIASIQNLFDMVLHFSVKPSAKMLFKVDLHVFYQDTSRDGFYHAGRGAPGTRAGIAGPARDYIGSELDFTLKYKVSSFLSFQGGYSKFWAGGAVKDRGRIDNAEFVYFQTMINF